MGPVTSDPVTVELASFNPAIFTLDLNGQGAVFFAQNLGTAVAPRDSGFQARPALRGEIIVIWCTGLGAVSNQPPTGEAANANGLVAEAIVTPTVRIGRFIAEVLFAGLSPEFPGLYQINVRVPDGTPSGFAVPVLVTTGSRRSNEVFIAVE